MLPLHLKLRNDYWPMRRLLFLFALWLCAVAVCDGATWPPMKKRKNAEPKSYIYRFELKDKDGTTGRLEQPQKFLSRKSLERRRRQGLPLDSTDLPVSKRYLKLLKAGGARIVGMSKWNNTVLVLTTKAEVVRNLETLDCVKRCRKVWESPDSIFYPEGRLKIHAGFNRWDSVETSRYASSEEQLKAVDGLKLHDSGFMGKGMTIAVLDGGFQNVDRLAPFSRVAIEGVRDFVYPNSPTVFQETDHGTKVLSAMAVNCPNVYIGSAPNASYWLLRCEDQQSEQLVEEDYWAMAAEFADSVGVDVINSSLGYNVFDDHNANHKYKDMDGHSTLISHSASLLASKGIVLVNSAGNNGMGPWKKITFPADANDILAVGAVTPELTNAAFCAVGPTQDGRVKPDVMAIGGPASVVSARGTVVQDMGTSFASPIVCGLVACLWQALPHKTAMEIMDLVRRSGNNYEHPDNIYGYGVPNFWNAYTMGNDGRRSGEEGTTE